MNRTAFPATRNRIATDLRQARGVRQTAGPSAHKDAFYTFSGPRRVLHTALADLLPTRMYVRGPRRTNRARKRGKRSKRGGRRRASSSWTGEETTRWVCRNVEYESRSFFSSLASRASWQLLLFLYRLPPCAAFQHDKSLDVARPRVPRSKIDRGLPGSLSERRFKVVYEQRREKLVIAFRIS